MSNSNVCITLLTLNSVGYVRDCFAFDPLNKPVQLR